MHALEEHSPPRETTFLIEKNRGALRVDGGKGELAEAVSGLTTLPRTEGLRSMNMTAAIIPPCDGAGIPLDRGRDESSLPGVKNIGIREARCLRTGIARSPEIDIQRSL